MGNDNSVTNSQLINPTTHNSSFYVKGTHAKKGDLLGFNTVKESEQFSYSQKLNRGTTVVGNRKAPKLQDNEIVFIERDSDRELSQPFGPADDSKVADSEIVMSNRNKFCTIEDYRINSASQSKENQFKQSIQNTNTSQYLKSSVADLLGKVNQMQHLNLNERKPSILKVIPEYHHSFMEDPETNQIIKKPLQELGESRIKLIKNKPQKGLSSKGSMKNLRGSLLQEKENTESDSKAQLEKIGVIISDPTLSSIISNRLSIEEIREKHNNTIEFDMRELKIQENEVRTNSSTDSIKDDNISTISEISLGNQSFISKTSLAQSNQIVQSSSNFQVDLLRKNYICMLIQNKIWVPGAKKASFNSIVIFDWDDTLMCTSFLTPHGVFEEDVELSDEDLELIAKLEFCVLRLLTMCFDALADVYIITNSQEGWIEYSANRFLPSISKLLSKIKVISARAQFENIFPNDSKRWKIEAYLSIRSRYPDVSTNLINMGDSLYDLEAGGFLAKQFKECYLKSVKFRECPTIAEMIKQLNLIINQFSLVFKSVKNMSIRVEKK